MKFLMMVFLLTVTVVFSSSVENIENNIGTYPFVLYQTLTENNGRDGKVWVSVGGFVYDLTDSKAWQNGTHMSRHTAGEELTYEILKESPHGVKKLDGKKIVGILALTVSDLKKFDGKNGRKAYVAVNGIVYDVTHSKVWKNGEHMRQHSAGSELTYEIINLSPHGLSKLDNVYPVGVLVFTLEDLKNYRGENGGKAYVAVEGIVYDVSYSRVWKNGMHMGQHRAGEDLTYEIVELSPHGLKKLENVYRVGYLVFKDLPEGYESDGFSVFKEGLKRGFIIY